VQAQLGQEQLALPELAAWVQKARELGWPVQEVLVREAQEQELPVRELLAQGLLAQAASPGWLLQALLVLVQQQWALPRTQAGSALRGLPCQRFLPKVASAANEAEVPGAEASPALVQQVLQGRLLQEASQLPAQALPWEALPSLPGAALPLEQNLADSTADVPVRHVPSHHSNGRRGQKNRLQPGPCLHDFSWNHGLRPRRATSA
jgi:hypothetical protein